ncbi:hypothetical protein F2Q69_00029188 [Brassica cretica]|uniref:Uncharacterized protein n=1 Tax=Brassica cretica TaxID=69181 RepID=A0A8S9SAL9_BRACR|nr:hypothetical protein F2Q69_00029188 [Brassica cretica]
MPLFIFIPHISFIPLLTFIPLLSFIPVMSPIRDRIVGTSHGAGRHTSQNGFNEAGRVMWELDRTTAEFGQLWEAQWELS